jgi:lipoprotein-anchoring transpeptidase ErfK/SrfK
MPHGALELPESIARRDFLKLSSFSLLALGLPVHWQRSAFGLDEPELGRVAFATAEVFDRPSFAADKLKTLWRDEVIDLSGAAIGDREPAHNRVWYQVMDLGFVHSSAIQPVRDEPNQPVRSVPYRGVLFEVSVPFVDVYWKPKTSAKQAYRFYYGTTHWINGVSRDVKERLWYRIFDDKYTYTYYARAEAFRPVAISELTPISSEVPLQQKRIEVDLPRQQLHCYEAGNRVFSTKISSGRKFSDGEYWTPEGNFITFRKRASRHMVAGNRANGYDLPGVPWVSYITEDGVAFHGTYWHNDFGMPRSHGCINMTSAAAKWLYRWTQPIVPAHEMEAWVSYGTRATVHL